MTRRSPTRSIVSLLLLVPGLLSALEPSERQIYNLARTALAEEFSIPVTAVELQLLHVPSVDPQHRATHYRVELDAGQRLRLGHRNLWLTARAGNQFIGRAPFSVNLILCLPVVVLTERIDRSTVLTADMVRMEERRLYRHHRGFYRHSEEVIGMLTSQVIAKGRVLGPEMLKVNPDIQRGDSIEVILVRGGVEFSLKGIARQDALAGEAIRVYCPAPRKEYVGLVDNHETVTVTL